MPSSRCGYRRPLSLDKLSPFSDPDGNGWLLQEVTTRLPGRMAPERPSTYHLLIWPVLCAVLRPRTVNKKRGLEKPTRIGQTGTPSS
jgi:hypothetical protein